MKHLDEYRERSVCEQLVGEILQQATRRWTVMEVCGGQTHGLLRYGIDQQLREKVELIHGPGCPVCVTPADKIDLAIRLALEPGVVLTTFGDMLRVPGSVESLQQARARGARVQLVYSPLDAVRLAQQDRRSTVVFFAVGFETTLPATAIAAQQALKMGLENFKLLVAHVRVLPAMRAVMQDPRGRVEGFLGAGHVCSVAGYHEYRAFADEYRCPVVITGFEPADLLVGIRQCVRLLEAGEVGVDNQYRRNVSEQGNLVARGLIDQVYQVCDSSWRGMGAIAGGGYRLRGEWAELDAERAGILEATDSPTPPPHCKEQCRSGEVLRGIIKPVECEFFGGDCTPATPLGAPMVSSEGACASYFQHGRRSRRA